MNHNYRWMMSRILNDDGTHRLVIDCLQKDKIGVLIWEKNIEDCTIPEITECMHYIKNQCHMNHLWKDVHGITHFDYLLLYIPTEIKEKIVTMIDFMDT